MATVSKSCGVDRCFILVAESLGLALLLATAGCSNVKRADYSALGLVDVTGTVRLDGAPLAGASVVFENEDRTFSSATTDSAGRYCLMFNSEQPGITAGKKIVRISSLVSNDDSSVAGSKAESIPARYNAQSQETAEVTNAQRTFDFDLRSDG